MVITQPDAALSSTETHVNVLCYGGNTGSIDLSPVGGTAPYTYLWTASLGGIIPAGQATNQDLSALVAGTYEVVITDANGSTGGCRATKTVVITQPTAVVLTAQGTEFCFGETGTITFEAEGGTGTITYTVNGNAATLPFEVTVAGKYSIVATDANQCTDTKEVDVIVNPLPKITCTDITFIVECTDDFKTNYDNFIQSFRDWYKKDFIANNNVGGDIVYWTNPSIEDLDNMTPDFPLVDPIKVTFYLKDNSTTPACESQCERQFGYDNTCAPDCSASDKDIVCYGETGSITVSGSNSVPSYKVKLYRYINDVKTEISPEFGEPVEFNTDFIQEYKFSILGRYDYAVFDGFDEGCNGGELLEITGPTSALVLQPLAYTDETCIDTNTGSITATFSGGTEPYQLQLDGGALIPNATSPYTFNNVSSDSHTVYVYDSGYVVDTHVVGCSDQETVTVGTIPCDDALCTYTQGAYGNSGGKYCDGNTGDITTANLIAQAITNAGGTITVGTVTKHSVSITGDDVNCVISKLPGGGAAKELTFGDVNICGTEIPLKNGKINNVLLSQTIALALNINIKGTNELANFELQAGTLATAALEGGCGTNVPKQRVCAHCENGVWVYTVNEYTYRTFSQTVIDALGGNNTVAGLLDLANRALANFDFTLGKEGGATLSEISNAVASINEVFDECRIPMGWNEVKCNNVPPVEGCPLADQISSRYAAPDSATTSTLSDGLIKVYPNPFKDHLTFEITTDVSTNASLQIFNMLGQKVFDVFNGYLEAGTTKVVEFNSPYSGVQTTWIYVYKLGEKTHTGKLIMEK